MVIEECLFGDEVSLFALCDGTDAVLLGAAQDHKRIGDGDTGPNTGGMGAVSPPAGFPLDAQLAALDLFIRPCPARDGGPRHAVQGHSVRGPHADCRRAETDRIQCATRRPRNPGDPAAPGLRIFSPPCVPPCDGTLGGQTLAWLDVASIAVVMAASGYPGRLRPKAVPITGFDRAAAVPHVAVFHAGTDLRDGTVIATGGRVLSGMRDGARPAERTELGSMPA